MHELSIAQSIVDYASTESERQHAKKVTELNVDVGELMQIDAEVLLNALKLLTTDAKMDDCEVHVRVVSASFSCRKCSSRWGMEEANKQLGRLPADLKVREPESDELPLHFFPSLYSAFIHCPRCGSSDIAVTEGEDVQIRRLVLE